MDKRLLAWATTPRAFQIACTVLLLLCVVRGIGVLRAGAASGDLEHDLDRLQELATKTATASAPSTLSELHQRAVNSPIFGVRPPAPPPPAPPRPALKGLVGNSAIIALPGASALWIEKGEEKEGIKVLDIAINRVLIEYLGETLELTIFSGVGSDSLLVPEGGGERQ